MDEDLMWQTLFEKIVAEHGTERIETEHEFR